MTRRVDAELVYAGATVEQVADMLLDPAFREAVCDHQGVLRRSASVAPAGGGRKLVLDYAHGVDRVPSFAKKFVGDEIPIHQEETWTGPRADVHVTIPGKPGDMTGTMQLAQRGDEVVHTVALQVKVGIPLVGGKIEELIAGLLEKAFRAENTVGRKWLAGEWRT
jgi:hypothetical protein